MYPVTQDFHDKMQAPERRILGRVMIDYTDWQIDPSLEVQTSEEANNSHPQQVFDGLIEPSYKYASLDGAWVLGQRYALAPGPGQGHLAQMGWWGEQLAGENGEFTEPYPTLTITHFPRPVHMFSVSGDSKRQEWAVDFVIRLYGEGDELLYTEAVIGNNAIHWNKRMDEHVTGVVKQELVVTRWSHEGRQVKILEFFSAIRQTYESGDLVSLHLLEEREVSMGTIPIGAISANEITVIIRNDDRRFDADNAESPLYGLIKPRRRILAWLGVEIAPEIVEWVPLGRYWAVEWQAGDDTVVASVTGRDRMEQLQNTTFEMTAPLENVSLYELAETVLFDAGLSAPEFEVDPALQGVVSPEVLLKTMSHREALRLIAEAGVATAYADRDGKIRVVAFDTISTEVVQEIGPDQYFRADVPLRYADVVNEVAVEVYPAGEMVVRRNEDSILDLGVLRFELKGNPLIQTSAQADEIAERILSIMSHPRRDIEIDWRGNPALELGDGIRSKGGEFVVIRNELDWAGALRARLTGRRA